LLSETENRLRQGADDPHRSRCRIHAAATGMPRARDTPRWFPRSLRRQLLLGVLAVVTVVLVTVGVASVLSLRGYVTTMNDAEVAKSLHAFNNSYTRYRNADHASAHRGTPPVSQALLEFTAQTPGNLISVLDDGV